MYIKNLNNIALAKPGVFRLEQLFYLNNVLRKLNSSLYNWRLVCCQATTYYFKLFTGKTKTEKFINNINIIYKSVTYKNNKSNRRLKDNWYSGNNSNIITQI